VLVMARGDFVTVNGCEALWRAILKLERQWNGDILTLLEQSQVN
jgi:hypothetical protein